MDVKKRSANVTEEQKTLLLQFMEENPRLMCGKFSSDFTYKDATTLWKELTDILNSCNGVNKDWKAWRKCWQDLRSRSKMKQSKINTERRATGGGNECNVRLNKIEEATLNLINPTCVIGHTEIMESDVQIQPETETSFEMDTVEYLDQDIENVIQQDEYHRAIISKAKNNNIQKYSDKENTPIVTCNVDENSNDSYAAMPTIKRKKKKTNKENVESTPQPTQILADVAKKSYEMQNSYYQNKLKLKEKELELKERLVEAAEKCNPS